MKGVWGGGRIQTKKQIVVKQKDQCINIELNKNTKIKRTQGCLLATMK
jgi:hypothetical protein